MVVTGMGLAQRGQAGKQGFPPTLLLSHRYQTPVSSIPSSRCVSLRKAQDGIANAVIHHRVVATLGLGAF